VVPLEREVEVLPVAVLLRVSCWVAALPDERVVVLPLEREVEVLPVVVLLRVSCWVATLPLERVAELLEREAVLLPEERVVLVPVERVVPPPVERDWASISGAMNIARASVMEAARVINLLIAS